jgi:predicted permease
MLTFLDVLTATVLPVLLITAFGYLLGRYQEIDVESVNTVTLYILAPALVFESLSTSSLSESTVFDVATGFVLFTVGMIVISEIVSRMYGITGSDRDALVVTSSFPNVGNFGIPVAAFAFGTVGRSVAVLIMITQIVVMYTFGTYLTTRSIDVSLTSAIKRILGIPVLYAVPIAIIVRVFDAVPPPENEIMRSITLLSDAAIPMFLIILGVQLTRTESSRQIADTLPALGLKSIVAPVVGLGSVFLLGIENSDVVGTFLIECAAPAAVTPLLLLIEFGNSKEGGGPSYAGTVIVVTLATCLPAVGLFIFLVQEGIVP